MRQPAHEEGEAPASQWPQGGPSGKGDRNDPMSGGSANSTFLMQDMVNFFSGLTALEIHNS